MFIDLRERERERKTGQLPPVHAPAGSQTSNLSVHRTTLQPTEPPCQGIVVFLEGPGDLKEGRINHESSQGKRASPFSSPTTQDIPKGAAALSLLSEYSGASGGDGPSRPAFSFPCPPR